MIMAVTLFEHNQAAYRAAFAMMDHAGRAAVIHPTGTGKSFIGFKLCEEHLGERVCWLAPSEHIYRTQLENWLRAGGEEPRNICFYTYARLMLMGKEELGEIAPEYIVLDEFHRCGAKAWGHGVERLLRQYPKARLLGLSATNIRYLDGRRDMAKELFGGCVASRMSLGEAVSRGILKPPKYVLAVYDWEESLTEYETKARRLRGPAYEAAWEALEELRRSLEGAGGLEEVFARYMPEPKGRYIVFCANVNHMKEMRKKAAEWFAKVDPAPHVYDVHSGAPGAEQTLHAFKTDESSHLKLLYCIDMLNEGVHVEGVNGVILLRPTASPTIYKQQIGRALAAGCGREPVIFDVVMNIGGLCSIGALGELSGEACASYKEDGFLEDILPNFQVTGEARDCIRLFWKLEGALGATWEDMYQGARQYWQEYGDLEIPRGYVDPQGRSLGAWVDTQRRIHSGKVPGMLTEEQQERLSAIGMRWEGAWDHVWEQKFSAAKAYWQEHGDLEVPVGYVSKEGILLGKWIRRQRESLGDASPDNESAWERRKRLTAIGMDWGLLDPWEQKFRLAQAYYEEHQSLDMPGDMVVEGVWLARWLNEQKARLDGRPTGKDKKVKSLNAQQVQKLESLGMKKGVSRRDMIWQRRYEEAKKFYNSNGHLRIPRHYIGEDGRDLGLWLRKQRERHTKGELQEVQTALLEEIGMAWNQKAKRTARM